MNRPFPSRCRQALIALALLAPSATPGPLAAQTPELSESALRQIQTLNAEKASWGPTERKLDPRLILEKKRREGDTLFKALPRLRSTIEIDSRGRTLVVIRGEVSDGLLNRVAELGGDVVASLPRFRTIRARLPFAELETLAAEPTVRSIRAATDAAGSDSTAWRGDRAPGLTAKKLNTSQGDVAHNADVARAMYGVDGSGVKVGVLAGGVDSLATVQASGDLPAVTVLSGQAGSGTAGTAHLEIVHDLAPGAELLFATTLGGQAQFAQNILDLRAAGADVLVDTYFYYSESAFQDGVVADAVNQVVADGALYLTSGNNSGNLNDGTAGVWEGDFAGTPAPAVIGVYTALDFGGGTNYDVLTVDSPGYITLQWSDPLGGSANDYDLFLLDSTRTSIIDSSIAGQDGDDDPFESIDSTSFNDTGNTLVVVQYSGAGRFIHLNTHGGELQTATAGQMWGHATAAGAFAVAAVNVNTASGASFTGGSANPVETFSPDGLRRIFFLADGTAITPGNFSSTGGTVRQKPDLAAADRVSTATPGFSTIFGTGPAAAHAAGIAALMREKFPQMTAAQARAIFAATALDIEAAGVDRDSGMGIPMADSAVAAAALLTPQIFSDGFASGNLNAWSAHVP